MHEQNCGCFGGKFVDFFIGVFQYPVLTSGCNSTYEWILGARGKSYGLPLVCFLRLLVFIVLALRGWCRLCEGFLLCRLRL